MKKIILILCLFTLIAGCAISKTTPSSGKDTSYTLDSVNPR